MKIITPKLLLSLLACLCAAAPLSAHEQQLYLSRFVPNLKYADADLTKDTNTATYKPIFGEGDRDAKYLNAITRMGELTVLPGGASGHC